MTHRRHRMPAPDARGAPRARGLPGRRAALVHRLRRQRHPRRRAAAVPRRGPAPGEDRVRLGHRLLEPLPALHEDLRLPRHPRPRAAGRRGHQDGAARPRRVRQHRRRRLLQHRRGALDPRHPLQHEHDGDAARQPRLRPDQEAGLADLAERPEEQHDAARLLSRGAQPADRDARRAERLVRRAGGRLDSRGALRHHLGGVPSQGLLVRAHPAALPGIPAQDVRALAARPAEDPAAHTTSAASSSAPALAKVYKNQQEHDPLDIDRAREIASGSDPIPVGILYHNPDVPCYEDLRHAGRCARPS